SLRRTSTLATAREKTGLRLPVPVSLPRFVPAATLASVALFWIESARSPASRLRPRPETTDEERKDSRGRGLVSPIREAESSPAETPRPSCAASDAGSEASSPLCGWAAETTDLAGNDSGSTSPNNKRKEKRRSLRKLLAKKLQNGKRPKEDKDSRHGGENGHPGAGEVSAAGPAKPEPPAEETEPPAPDVVTDARRHRRRGGALPLAAFVPVILVGLVAGKLPAVALTVLCAMFFNSVERAPDVSLAQASGHGRSDPSASHKNRTDRAAFVPVIPVSLAITGCTVDGGVNAMSVGLGYYWRARFLLEMSCALNGLMGGD
ncbi:hypothetical protein BAE44_0013731, partial [Dichanthelium oligosanthes]